MTTWSPVAGVSVMLVAFVCAVAYLVRSVGWLEALAVFMVASGTALILLVGLAFFIV